MSGFDEYFGLSVTTIPLYCPQCKKHQTFYEEKKECSICKFKIVESNEQKFSTSPFPFSSPSSSVTSPLSLPPQLERLLRDLGISPTESPLIEEMMRNRMGMGNNNINPTLPTTSTHSVEDQNNDDEDADGNEVKNNPNNPNNSINNNTNSNTRSAQQLSQSSNSSPSSPIDISSLIQMMISTAGGNGMGMGDIPGDFPFPFPSSSTDSSHQPVSDAFLSSPLMTPRPLSSIDFLRPLVMISSFHQEFSVVPSDFGFSLYKNHQEGEMETCHAVGTLMVDNNNLYGERPFTKCNDNSESVSTDLIYLVKRGKVTFVTKGNHIQMGGGTGGIVIQEGGKWPFVMTDSKSECGEGKGQVNIKIPMVGISQRDGEMIMKRITPAPSIFPSLSSSFSMSSLPTVKILTRHISMICPICNDDLNVGSLCIQLSCRHSYCPQCITQWLKKRNQCALCRGVVEVKDDDKEQRAKKEKEEKQTEGNKKVLHEAMFS